MLYGLLNLPFWGYTLVTFISIQISFACITIFLHRSQAHRALDLHPMVSHFCRFWLWFTTGMQTKEWVAVHRKHHAKCETAEDPHSPQVLGLRKVLLEGAELYRGAAKNNENLERYGRGTPDDWLERNVYTRYSMAGVTALFVIDLLLFGVPGITVWAVQMMATPFCAAGLVNGVGHFFGYRNFECPDAARNIFPWGLLVCGEELHNNHHTFASSAKFSVKWWEVDTGWLYIRLLQLFKLAKVKKVPPKLRQDLHKVQIDVDTLTAVIANRFQVLAHYGREVIVPVLREEQAKASAASRVLLQRAKKLLTRADNLLDDVNKQHISHLLEKHQALELVYQYRQKLQEIWNRSTANRRELVEALQQWCKDAEATGIRTLRDFAQRLSSYSTPASALGVTSS